MASIETTIPAFLSWKVFNDTMIMPDVFKKEESVTRLVSIIKSSVFENSFVHEKDPTLSYNQYEQISNMYKSFTSWVLGRFFYAMSNEKLHKIHQTLIDVQKYILIQLSKTQPNVYRDLILEYGKALNLLTKFSIEEKNVQKLVLEIFKPSQHEEFKNKIDLTPIFAEISSKSSCSNLLNNITKIFQYIIPECFTSYCFEERIVEILENYLVLLNKGSVSVKVNILELYGEIVQRLKLHKNFSRDIENILQKFHSYFEKIVCETFSENIEMSSTQYHSLESVIKIVYMNFEFIKDGATKSKKFTHFLYHISSKDSSKYSPSEGLMKVLVPYLQKLDIKFETVGKMENFLIENLSTMSFYKICILKKQVKSDILNYCSQLNSPREINVYKPDVSRLWNVFCEIFLKKMEDSYSSVKECLVFFNKLSVMLLEITIEVRNDLIVKSSWLDVSVIYFEESSIFFNMLVLLNEYIKDNFNEDIQDLYSIYFVNLALLTNTKNLDMIFAILAYPYLIPNVYLDTKQMPCQLIGFSDSFSSKKAVQAFYECLSTKEISKIQSLRITRYFLEVLSSGLLQNLNESHVDNIQLAFLKICKFIMKEKDNEEQFEIMQTIPHVLSIFSRSELYLNEIFIPKLNTVEKKGLKTILSISSYILCTSYSDYIKRIELDDIGMLSVEICCEKCDLNISEKSGKIEKFKKKRLWDHRGTIINFCHNKIDLASLSNNVLKKCLGILTADDVSLKICSLKILPSVANHVVAFNDSVSADKIWLEKMDDDDIKVRKVFAEILLRILRNKQENPTLSDEEKKVHLDLVLQKLFELTKKSLKFSKFELQNTLLLTIKSIIELKSPYTVLPLYKIILYFIMIPTSKYSIIAVNKLYYLAETYKKTPFQIYVSHTRDICETIVHLCAVNQVAVNYSLSSSLKKVSMIFGLTEKDFIIKENQYLLPFLVAKIKTMPKVEKLIEEMAVIMDVELPELLASKYGYIFLQTFLNQSTDGVYKVAMAYLEKTTGLNGESLRRKNFRVILNNLLLHFHKKNREVVLALHLLVKEDTEKRSADIPEYLQSHFLGVLQFFLNTLISEENNHEETLESLSDIFSFMGSKHITPLRFKIISMLQTVDYKKYPSLVSDVWFTFLKCCEVEMLGPQLATIFKSIQPLIDICPNEINKIYTFLICENESKVGDYIKDLFFMENTKICPLILRKLNTYLSEIERYTFKQKIKWLLKYLTHETIEIRVEGMKELKLFMERNREELDRMILGYNGIDETIVELIDVLTLTCREKDKQLKLACAEVIGELGALEPSHLPRRYALDTRAFSFFIYEDNFVINALNELTKALQAEKNAVNMDRTALAIQEILKTYKISPDKRSCKHSIWEEFTEAQQELMMPLLSSRYISALNSLNFEYTIPIYGSPSGSSFQLWLYNWTCSLISKLPPERRTLLECCLPSMKEGERVLMHFLPHILLHALIEGGSQESAYEEFQAVLSSFNERNDSENSVLNVVTVPLPGVNVSSKSETLKEFWRSKCTKIAFILLDFLDRWLREWQWRKKTAGRNDPNFKKVKNFLSRFCRLQLAKCNYQCGEYPRALMYLEDFITENPTEVADNLSFLAEVYAQLDEPDGVAGTMALRQTEPSIEDRILALEVSGKLADAAACYERIKPPLKLHHLQGLVQCYLDLDNVNTALNFAYGAMSTHMDYGNMLLEMQAEPLWRLGRFDILDDLLKQPEMRHNKSWGVQIGKALIHFDKGERNEFKNTLNSLRLQQVDFLGAASLEEGAYQHGYSYISRLHSLNELQRVENFIYELQVRPNDNKLIENVINKLKHEWELRIKVVQESVRIVEPILCLRRVALERGKKLIEQKLPNAIPHINSLLGECWLLSAKTARSARVHQQAYTYTLKAEEFAPPDLFIEKARLHWLREENEQAMTTLKRGLAILLPNPNSQSLEALSLEQRKLCAEARLMIATYNDSTSNVEADINLQNYKDAYEVHKGWEKSLVCLGQYYDRRFQSYSEEEKDSKASDIQIAMIKYFGHSLLYGSTFVYQSLPRLLSIWFDYGTRLLDVTQTKIREERRSNLLKMTHLIDNCLEKVPLYIFLSAFSQLVSRICHPQREVYIELKSIIIKLLLHYPQQTLWMMIPIIKSSYSMRTKRCGEIFNDPKLKNSSIATLVRDFTALAEKLIELCNKEVPSDVSSASVNALLRSLPRMIQKSDFSEIMIPTHKFRKLVLPNPDFKNSDQHNPFPNQYVHIVGIEDEMTILASLQRPRKITLRGSDGKGYIQMLKPKDDLRKDFRLMEFNDIVNQLLTREAEARERRLNIRLYSVAPLNEECGLIEWVPNLLGLRPILMTLYNQRGLGMRNAELKEVVCDLRDPLAKKREVFVKKLIVRHPPILGEWFRKNFPDAQSWLTARTAFIRTTAVISMVGYILGLGDRHGENISIDSTCGDTVHVDFNCLFNKGEALEYPERVPFRLTHNMVSAMGPLGIEGMFRKSCICTLGVLRTNTPTLMSIVTPFVYDPLVSWPRIQVHAVSAERTNEQAVEHIKNIELRLQGVIKTRGRSQSISPLSVEGQTNYLIKEAMSIDNLCQMYYGWGAFL